MESNKILVRFQVLTAASVKTVFWVVASCSLAEKLTNVSEVLIASIIRTVVTC
jgi:hypothetical protein